MGVIVNLSATTELEAVNAMLAAVGTRPLPADTDLDNVSQADGLMAVNILRNATREVQSMKWKFNTEFGFEISPSAQYTWIDTAGVSTVLNIFTPPAGMIAFSVTPIIQQLGCRLVDTEIRPSRKYTVDAESVMVFYDRRRARDGFPASDHQYLYINPVWLFGFEQMPESARRYVTGVAARRFVQQTVGSDTLSAFSARDEAVALRTLKREQGEEDNYNFLSSSDSQAISGGRPGTLGGAVDWRKNRNTT